MPDTMTGDDYRVQLQALLPRGPAWQREPDALLTSLLDAHAAEYARVHNRGTDLLDEMIPPNTVEMLPDWERVAGLPDECTVAGETLEARRRAVLTRLAARGGQSPGYYTRLAEIFGWDIEVTEYRRFRAGSARAGDPLTNDTDPKDGEGDPPVDNADSEDGWVHVWRVKADSPVAYFRAGSAAAGEPLASWGNEALECLLNKWKPAHTLIVFDYS